MNQLGNFADSEPPQLLWRNNGQYRDLFIFMASRFLSAPDHVLDAEGTHAMWKWLETVKRGITFRTLNAVLRLQSYLRANGEFPQNGRLEELCAIVAQRQRDAASGARRQLIEDLGADEVGRGVYERLVYQDRFNLHAAEMRLVRHFVAGPNANTDATAETAWGNYVRFLLEPNCFYQFSELSSTTYLFIGRNRAAPGREKLADTEAQGRLVTYAWFEVAEEFAHEGHIVRPVTVGRSKSLELRNATVAELIRAGGKHIEAEGTIRDMEIKYEAAFATLGTINFDAERFEGRRSEWSFALSGYVDAEEAAFMTKPVADLTKMALARRLQILEGSTDAVRARRWELTKEALIGLIVAHDGGGGDVHVGDGGGDEEVDGGAPRGRGRARGRGGRAVGRGGRGRRGRGGRG